MAPAQGANGVELQQGCIAALLLLAGTAFLDPFWGHVLREVFLFATSCTLALAVSAMQGSLSSTYELLDNLLGNMCDGYVLLRNDGSVSYADPMSTDTLGLAPSDSCDGAASGTAFGDGGGVVIGLRTLRMTVRGKRLEVETYTVPCPPPFQGLSSILARNLRAPPPLTAEGHNKHLCTIRIRQEQNDADRSSAIAQAAQRQPVSLRQPLPSPSATPVRGRQQHDPPSLFHGGHRLEEHPPSLLHGVSMNNLIQPEECTDTEELSELGSVLPHGGGGANPGAAQYQMPGSAWQAIRAVGLGVGSYKKVRMIARGGQGSVWQVVSQDGVQYAEKDIFLKGVLWHVDFPKRLRDADREVRALKGLAFASAVIIPIIDCWIQNDFEQACIVMEWLPLNLNQVLKKQRLQEAPVPTADACNWLAGLSLGVAAIHSAGFIHRDLKTANILLDEQKQRCKIADLGVSRPLHRREKGSPDMEAEEMASQVSVQSEKTKLSMATSVQSESILSGYTARPGTNAYTSPEALEGSDYDTSSDIFSLGCILFEVLTLEMPPELELGDIESTVPVIARKLLGAPRPDDNDPGAALAALCLRMLSQQASDRPSAQKVASHPILRRPAEKLMQECPRLRSVLTP
mmetsp:Transcript_76339/g.223844  ORF Transcript_76339/g.223844 Transcript_76339/m.223844 type:complete len:630 (+) Transcript_76339:57-1946(+)